MLENLKGRERLEDLDIRMSNIKMDLKEIAGGGGCALDLWGVRA
jgi:hypothetical protein